MAKSGQHWLCRKDYVRVASSKRKSRGHAYCVHGMGGEVRIVRIHRDPRRAGSTRRRNHLYDTGVRRVTMRSKIEEPWNAVMCKREYDIPTALN